jgi:hypothetical protein
MIILIHGLLWGMSLADSHAATYAACSSYVSTSDDDAGRGVIDLLKGLSIDTTWEQLPPDTKERLQALADKRLAFYRSQWAMQALASKQDLLFQSPTPGMIFAINRYYRTSYKAFLPETFSFQDVIEPALRKALVLNYLGVFAAARATLTYPGGSLPNCDWDGASVFDSARLPDKKTYEDIKAYNRAIVEALSKIDDSSLRESERKLKQYVLFSARSNAVGSAGASYGSDYMEQPCEVARLNYDILAGYEGDHQRPKMFASDEIVLREVNAIYLNNTPLKWLDVGTRASALSYCMTPQVRIKTDVGDPATNDVARGMILLQNWWIERLLKVTAHKCTTYSAKDRVQIWDAFSADQQFNNDGNSSMETYQVVLAKYKADKIEHYRRIAQTALRLIFPDETVLTRDQLNQVLTALAKREDFGLLAKAIYEDLDAAQGTSDGQAARLWADAIDKSVAYIGGNYSNGQSVRSGEADEIKAMFEEVKSWIASHYSGYPIPISALLKRIDLDVTTKDYPFAENGTAKILIGVGTRRSRAEYYSWLLHELRHAVNFAWHATAPDKTKLADDEGPANEGSGVAVEDLLLWPFLEDTIKSKIALVLYSLEYGIRDARFVATTDATLQKYLRPDCSRTTDLDTVEFTKRIALAYGLTERRADTVAERAHAEAQYLNYIWGGLYMLDELRILQSQMDSSRNQGVDPFVLFVCGLNTPRRDKSYVDALRTCMKLRQTF